MPLTYNTRSVTCTLRVCVESRPSDDDSYDDAGSAEWRTDDEDSFGNETSNGKAKAESNVFVRARNSVSRSPRRCIPVTNPICDAVLPYRTTFVKAQHDIKRMAMTSLVSSVVRSNRTTCDQESAVRFDCALRYPKCEEEKGLFVFFFLRIFSCCLFCSSFPVNILLLLGNNDAETKGVNKITLGIFHVLGLLQAFEESADWALLSFFAIIQTCTCLHSSD